jgi:hypothetical protein
MPSRSGRHRAPSAHSRALSTMAAAGAALSASLLTPATALAASHADHRHASGGTEQPGGTRHGTHRATRYTRPMTSGERQYRNGCQQGYITEDCERFSITELLRHGINPYL